MILAGNVPRSALLSRNNSIGVFALGTSDLYLNFLALKFCAVTLVSSSVTGSILLILLQRLACRGVNRHIFPWSSNANYLRMLVLPFLIQVNIDVSLVVSSISRSLDQS
ncbi:hypothetical protein CDL15_Pgr015665 [Punica granatum]|uniref:Uncharacterized protein n=1 Tax=Punica granatum TaxID=22663 RepID=A0A218XP74_PUNGR|nr:hypothetical protein CDL15_Pgr015665 [Punica granatum]